MHAEMPELILKIPPSHETLLSHFLSYHGIYLFIMFMEANNSHKTPDGTEKENFAIYKHDREDCLQKKQATV